METSQQHNESAFPWFIEPTTINVPGGNIHGLTSWLKDNHEWFERQLLSHGALLFRRFAIKTPIDFEAFVQSTKGELLAYVEGNSPRDRVTGNIYTSTAYPAEYRISLHNELSYAHTWPSKLFFFCHVPPDSGGETPIADCRRVLDRLDTQVRDAFVEKRVKYIHNMHGDHGVGKSWQKTFETDDRRAVEDYLKRGDVQLEWKKDGGLRTSQVRPATRSHPKTGDLVWFNQADQWHPSNLDKETREALLNLLGEDLPHNCFFSDGTPIEESALDHIREVMWSVAVANKWEQGDVLVIDNMLAAHGRMSYRGRREILVAMT